MEDATRIVLGNHDLHLLAVAAGVRQPNRSDTLKKILKAPDRETLLTWLLHRPLLHTEQGFTMVHAGIPPQWSVTEAGKRAREVEAVLQSPDCTEFFKHMYGNEPLLWSDELTGMTRLRVITNYLTRMRYCTSDGMLDLVSKGPEPPCDGKKVSAWFSHPKRKTRDDKILFGHWASLEGFTDTPNAIGLDTGCVWGLEGKEGWALCESNINPDLNVMPMWSQPEYAQQHCEGEWASYKPIAISLEELPF